MQKTLTRFFQLISLGEGGAQMPRRFICLGIIANLQGAWRRAAGGAARATGQEKRT